MRMPDFIIIGAMKCATSTLHEQLARQAGIFMSAPKEPNFFSNDEQWERGIGWYAELFGQAVECDICGESSTHYTKLPTYPHTIQRMREHLGDDVKLIYIMRHPIDRLISHYIHEWTQRVISSPVNEAVDEHPELIAYSRYAMQLQPFFEAFGRESILPVFFDRLSYCPQEELSRVCRFIGYAGRPQWDAHLQQQNVSSQRTRRSKAKDLLMLFPGSRAFRRTFVPQSARNWIKDLWTMKKRPELSEQRIEQLTTIFDEDLAILGRWLGIADLRCDTFNRIAHGAQAHWTRQDRGGDE